MSSCSSGLGARRRIHNRNRPRRRPRPRRCCAALSGRTAAYFIGGGTEVKKLTTRSIEDEDDYERAAPASSPDERELIPTEHTQPVTTKANEPSAFARLAPKLC